MDWVEITTMETEGKLFMNTKTNEKLPCTCLYNEGKLIQIQSDCLYHSRIIKEEPFIYTYTGNKFRPYCPREQDVDIRDIAHSLSFLCRYNGQCRSFYSVASHSLFVCSILAREFPENPKLLLWGLLHDAAEAYIGDLAKPIKYNGHLGMYFRIQEQEIQKVIMNSFGMGTKEPPEVKKADHKALEAEIKILFEKNSTYSIPQVFSDPESMEKQFLQRFYELHSACSCEE